MSVYCTEQNKYSFKRLKTHRFAKKEIVKLINLWPSNFPIRLTHEWFLGFPRQEITLHPNYWINDLQDPTWSTPQCVTLISLVRMYSLYSSDKSKITQILHAYPISFRRIRDDFLFCCKLTLQTEHCYFPRCAMTPKVNARHKQQCVRPVELRELSILPGQSSHVIFIFKFYWVFGIPYLNKQFHLKSACS